MILAYNRDFIYLYSHIKNIYKYKIILHSRIWKNKHFEGKTQDRYQLPYSSLLALQKFQKNNRYPIHTGQFMQHGPQEHDIITSAITKQYVPCLSSISILISEKVIILANNF